jgi:hypothetical protein
MAEKSRTTGVKTVLQRGLAASQEGPTRTAHQSERHE